MNEFESKEKEQEELSEESSPAVENPSEAVEENAPETEPAELSEEPSEELSEDPSEPDDAPLEETVLSSEESKPAEKAKRSGVATLYDYLETFCYALALMMVLFLFVFRYVSVDGTSMETTLHDEDKLIISNLFYTPETGDIVVINPDTNGGSSEPIIKRVIATEGQTVFIDYENWEVYVDGVKLDEPYIDGMRPKVLNADGTVSADESVMMRPSDFAEYNAEFTVGEGMVFVMGDNRNGSKDSRDAAYGEMHENRILGRVIIRIAPDFGFVD